MAEERSLDVAQSSSVDIMALNNTIVSMRKSVKHAKIFVIRRLVHKIKQLKTKPESQNKVKAKVQEISIIKKLDCDRVSKFALSNQKNFDEICKPSSVSAEVKALGRLSHSPVIQKEVALFRGQHSDWQALSLYLMAKQSGRRFRKRKNMKPKQAILANRLTSEAMTANLIETKLKGYDIETLSCDKLRHESPDRVKRICNESVAKKEQVDNQQVTTDCRPNIKKIKSKSRSKTKSNKTVKQIVKKDKLLNTQDILTETSQSSETANCESVTSSTETNCKDISTVSVKSSGTKVIPTSREMVVKQIFLDSIDDSSTIDILTEEVAVVRQPTCQAVAKKLKDRFFVGDNIDTDYTTSDEELANDKLSNDNITNDDLSAMTGYQKLSSHFISLRNSKEETLTNSFTAGNKDAKFGQNRKKSEKISKEPILSRQESSRQNKASNKTHRSQVSSQHSSETFSLTKGQIHPSWEASKKRRLETQMTQFAGKKTTFDDSD